MANLRRTEEGLVLHVTVIENDDPVRSQLLDSTPVAIGRDSSNDLVLRDRFVSDAHGVIAVADGTTRFRDLRSTHGSFVRRNRWVIPVDESCSFEVQLQDGDELLLGCAEPPARLCLSITARAGEVSRRPDTEALEQAATRPEPVD